MPAGSASRQASREDFPECVPMFCGECGTENPETNRFCKSCGKPLKQKQQPASAAPAPAAAPASPAPVAGPVPVAPAAGAASPAPAAAPAGGGRKRTWIIAGAILALVILAAAGVMLQTGYMTVQVSPSVLPGLGSPPGVSPGSAASPGTPAGKPVHGTITSGPVVAAAQGSVSAAGGTVTVNQPGSAINGLVFSAPAGAYPAGQQVTIGSSPITAHTFGSNFNPATPLISIDAGTGYAEEPVLVTIPVSIPKDQFAMAFYYDNAAQKLEGIPTVARNGTSITVATRHFSNIVVSLISLTSLDGIKSADSGFRPGTDDWEFDNAGSYAAPSGHCSGQSITMMWYYSEQRQKADAPALFNRYDNNGRDPARQLARDDTLGYRFASVMQNLDRWDEYWQTAGRTISGVSDPDTFREFKYAIFLTGEPQYVYISRTGGSHAIVCYEVSDTTLWIADPNYPGKERMIVLNGNTLGPYTSGASSTDIRQNGVRVYPSIHYIAKSAMFSYPAIAAEYAKVKDGTIGTGAFPAYKLVVIVTNDDGTEQTFRLDGGTNSKVQRLDIRGKTVRIWPESDDSGDAEAGNMLVSAPDGSVLKPLSSNRNPLTLAEGSNLLAVELISSKNSWVGFDWLDLNYKPAAPAATTVPATTTPAAQSGQHYISRVYAIGAAPACAQYAALSGLFSPDDPYCLPPTQLAGAAYGSIICGQPPAGCIDTTAYNHGIQAEHRYYIREETNSANGASVHNRIKDGAWTEWYVDGSVMDQWTYKDGERVK